MRIIFDQAVYDMRNTGNIAQFQIAVSRIQEMWPEATLEVLTLSPYLLRLYCPDAVPVMPDGSGYYPTKHWSYAFIKKFVPNTLLQLMLEVREAIWRRNISIHDIFDQKLLKLKKHPEHSPVFDDYSDDCDTPIRGAERYISMLRGVDLFIATGAQYMSDVCRNDALRVLDRLEAAMRLKIPTVMVGQGLGPMKDPVLLKRAREIFPKLDLIFIREKVVSLPLLSQLGVDPAKVYLTGDDAVELAFKARSDSIGGDIGVGLRIANYIELDHENVRELRKYLQSAAKKYQACLVALPISHSAHEIDDVVIRYLLEGYPKTKINWRRLDEPTKLIKNIGDCRIVVAGTYHAVLFALAQGIPAIGLAKSAMYIDKFRGLIDLFGPACQVVQMDDAHMETNLLNAIEAAWQSSEAVRASLLAAAELQVHWGLEAYHQIYALIEGIQFPL
jgi:polysaccharide pyruvyl transferase WcaK-like protein